MGGRIDCYIDIASFYSFLAFGHLVENLPILEAHGVQVEFHPILLGAVNSKTGNKPPWMLPARAHYLAHYEAPRAQAQFRRPHIRQPKDLMAVGLTVLPLRCLHHVKAHYPQATYHALVEHLYRRFWYPPNADLTKVEVLREALLAFDGDGGDDGGKKKVFTADECAAILDAAQAREAKDALARATGEALERGAFGAPWLWVTPGGGKKAEPFFGSDRFHQVWNFLGLPYQEVALLPPEGGKSKL